MATRGQSIRKGRPKRTVRSRLLIVTEGQQTEVQYFQGPAQYLKTSGVSVRGIRIKGVGSDPSRVLKTAREIGADDTADYDEVWAVVDVDDHATLDQALTAARRASIPMVVSNPCFEIWLVWHYQDCSAHRAPKQLQDSLDREGHSSKHLPPSFPFDRLDYAQSRASRDPVPVRTKGPNPSSAIPELIAALHRA